MTDNTKQWIAAGIVVLFISIILYKVGSYIIITFGDDFIDLGGDGIPVITNTERTLKTLLDALPDRFTIKVS